MARTVTLAEAYAKLGPAGLRSALSEGLTISPILDAPRFQREWPSGIVSVRGVPVGVIEQVLRPGLAAAVKSVSDRDGSLSGVFEFAYFPKDRPILLEYKESVGGVSLVRRVSRSGSSVAEAARVLGVDLVRPIHAGALTEEQQVSVIRLAREMSKRPVDEPELTEALGISSSVPRRGIRFDSRRASFVVPSLAYEGMRAEELAIRESVDMQGLVLSDFAVFFETELDLQRCAPSPSLGLQEQVLDVVSNVFVEYCNSRSSTLDDLVVAGRKFDVDESLVREDVRRLMEMPNRRELFQMILNSVRSPKTKATGTMTGPLLRSMQAVSETILGLCGKDMQTVWPTYDEFLILNRTTQ